MNITNVSPRDTRLCLEVVKAEIAEAMQSKSGTCVSVPPLVRQDVEAKQGDIAAGFFNRSRAQVNFCGQDAGASSAGIGP